MKEKSGLILMIIGTLHCILGLIKYAKPFTAMINEGVVNTANTTETKLAFWFTFTGIVFTCLGYLINFIEKRKMTVPKPLGWMLFSSSILGVIFLPISGFWLTFLPSVLILLKK